MIGVTIRSGPTFNKLSDEAVERFKHYTGIDRVVIFDTDKNPYLLKLRLHTYFKQTFVYFDSDLWFTNPCSLVDFNNSKSFYAVKDIGRNNNVDFPKYDSYWNGIDNEAYFNTGFFIANGNDKLQCDAFEYSWGLHDKIIVRDFGEQTFLNIGIQRFKVPTTFLHQDFNYPIICEEFEMTHKEYTFSEHPKAIHALGYKGEDKINQLNKYSIIKSHESLPMSNLPSNVRSSFTSVLP
jgi:hypothetical protein